MPILLLIPAGGRSHLGNLGLEAEQIEGSRVIYDDFNAFCGALRATSYVVQWRGSHVWKVGGKVFAIGGRGCADSERECSRLEQARAVAVFQRH